MNNKQQILFLWEGPPRNFVNVCLQSLREYNKDCVINFFYNNRLTKLFYKKYNLKFIRINDAEIKKGQMFYKVKLAKDLSNALEDGTKLLVLDLDLLFQDDPFKMFTEYKNNDLYYTCSILSTKDSLRPKKVWMSIDYKVNGGVWGIKISSKVKKFMEYWVDNLINPTWINWKEYKYNKIHSVDGNVNLNWWCDQDFLNCIEESNDFEKEFQLKKINVGYQYNYFTSTWGFFNPELSMGNKIGNSEYKIIHFKGKFKQTFNLNNRFIYNFKNIINKKELTTTRTVNSLRKMYDKRQNKEDLA